MEENTSLSSSSSSLPIQDYGSSVSPKRKKSSRFFLLILFIVVVGILLFVGNMFLSNRKGSQTGEVIPTITPLPTEDLFPTEPVVTESPTSTPAPTPTPTTNPIDKQTGLDRSELSVAVKNGSGEVGAASKISEALKGFGYHVVSVGNADTFSYENVTIEVKSEKSSYLGLLKRDLGLSYTIGTTSADLLANASSDAVVTVGK